MSAFEPPRAAPTVRDSGLIVWAMTNALRNRDEDGAAALLDQLGMLEERAALRLACRMLAASTERRPGGLDLYLREWRARE